MPFNQLILPLLAGYLLVRHSYASSYWASRQPRESLLLASALAGFALLALTRTAIVLLPDNWRQLLGATVARLSSHPYMGTSVATLLVGLIALLVVNRLLPKEEAAIWTCGKGACNELENLLFYSFLRAVPDPEVSFRSLLPELWLRLLAKFGLAWAQDKVATPAWIPLDSAPVTNETPEQDRAPIPLMLVMKDRKVYVGWLQTTPPLLAGAFSYIKLYVAWSGYRDKDTLRVVRNAHYDPIFRTVGNPSNSTLPAIKVLPVCDIASANLYDLPHSRHFRTRTSRRTQLFLSRPATSHRHSDDNRAQKIPKHALERPDVEEWGASHGTCRRRHRRIARL